MDTYQLVPQESLLVYSNPSLSATLLQMGSYHYTCHFPTRLNTIWLRFYTHSPGSISTPTSNPSLSNFLVDSLTFSEPEAISISNSFSSRKNLKNSQSVVHFLKQLGFSDAHIQSSVRLKPKILFSDVDKTLKPKLQFFQDLGLTGPDLGNFISTHSHVLLDSLERTLIPYVDIIKKTLINDKSNWDLFLVLQRSYSVSVSRLKCNIAFLESCGIVGLPMLLKKEPQFFVNSETALRDLVSRVLDMGFSVDSRMFVHAMCTVGNRSRENFSRKIEVLRSFGFSMDECMDMFRRVPSLLTVSEGKLKLGMVFFLYDVKLERSALFSRPMYVMGQRVLPRYRVLQIMKCKRLLKKEPSLLNVLVLTEEKFLLSKEICIRV